tara:strand:+ start:409 stop:657 length:249 start_codon:yes stop_codon:yes gene_type:complete
MTYKRKHKFEVGDLVDYYSETGVVVGSGYDTKEAWEFPQTGRSRAYYVEIKHPVEPQIHKIFEGTAMWNGVKLLAQGKTNGT